MSIKVIGSNLVHKIPAKKTESGGGGGGEGAVTSVNGKTGAVVLSASDVGAGTYSKPSGGIPKSDLSEAVRVSLGKADTALQTAPVTSVNGQTGSVLIDETTLTTISVSGTSLIIDNDYVDGNEEEY